MDLTHTGTFNGAGLDWHLFAGMAEDDTVGTAV